MTAPELALHCRGRFEALEAAGRRAGFEQIRQGIIDHTDLYEVVGYEARLAEPRGFHDGLSLRITFVSFPQPAVSFLLQWTSWMADPSMKIRADFPPLVVKQTILSGKQAARIQPLADRYLELLAGEIARREPPGFLARWWLRLVG